ncbi:hypothetical protein DER44DRAFT_809475 [Fusarium oxysporum]|nr:hypothetical protein DER44DRAFT_809475 [Fusarium oxysporum]
MSVNLPADHVEVAALRDRVKHISEENKFVNNENDYLQESNGGLAIQNNKLKKTLALTEERLQRHHAAWRVRAVGKISWNDDMGAAQDASICANSLSPLVRPQQSPLRLPIHTANTTSTLTHAADILLPPRRLTLGLPSSQLQSVSLVA